MAWKSHQLAGQKFGRLSVVSKNESKKFRQTHWNCQCECGNELVLPSTKLTHRKQQSCGCLRDEQFAKRTKTHGQRSRDEYRIWAGMKDRCRLESGRMDYSGRGIKVCDRWMESYENFFSDMGERPSKKHSLERKDVNGNYEPNNCKWATSHEQFRNKTNNRWIVFGDMKLIMSDWAKIMGIRASRLCTLLKTKSFEEVFTQYTGV